jgi:hypothetical protein
VFSGREGWVSARTHTKPFLFTPKVVSPKELFETFEEKAPKDSRLLHSKSSFGEKAEKMVAFKNQMYA